MTIKIWKSNPPYSNTPIKVLAGHSRDVNSLLYIKERDIMISGSDDRTLRLWNMSTYQCENMIEGVRCIAPNALYQIDKNRVIVGGWNTFSIVNIDKCVIEKTIEDGSFGKVKCFLKLKDNNKVIICASNKEALCFYDMNTKCFKTTNIQFKKTIDNLLLIDDCTFISGNGIQIDVWEFYY